MQGFNFEVAFMDRAILMARNPKESWLKSDSRRELRCKEHKIPVDSIHNLVIQTKHVLDYYIGPNDYKLAKGLILAGSDHRKFLRQIVVFFDMIAPEYFWWQYHTYKVGTTENSTSTMHRLGSRYLVVHDFEFDNDTPPKELVILVKELNNMIKIWRADKKNRMALWRKIVQLLPRSFLFLKSCTCNYENLLNMYQARNTHKLQKEWRHKFLDIVLANIPYPEFVTKKFD